MEELEGAEEAVEDVVGGKHLDKVLSVNQGRVEDPSWIHPAPGRQDVSRT